MIGLPIAVVAKRAEKRERPGVHEDAGPIRFSGDCVIGLVGPCAHRRVLPPVVLPSVGS